MHDLNIYNIQLSDLQLFLNVAKYGSFTKAGEKMFMTQSWVSKRMSMMERELELSLFIRSKRELVLTPAGRVLEERIRGVIGNVISAIQEANDMQTGTIGTLRIGYLDWGNIETLKMIKRFMGANPQAAVEIYKERFPNLRSDVTSGRLDIIFTTSYECREFANEDFSIFTVCTVPLIAYMSPDNPLAGQGEIEMGDLQGQPMLMVDPQSSSGYGAHIRDIFIKHGIRPKIVQYAGDGGEHIGNILVNKGVLLASEYFLANTLEDAIARVPVKGESVNINAIWRKRNPSPILGKFVADLKESLESPEPKSE